MPTLHFVVQGTNEPMAISVFFFFLTVVNISFDIQRISTTSNIHFWWTHPVTSHEGKNCGCCFLIWPWPYEKVFHLNLEHTTHNLPPSCMVGLQSICESESVTHGAEHEIEDTEDSAETLARSSTSRRITWLSISAFTVSTNHLIEYR